MTTHYEWAVEVLDGPEDDADILDVSHWDTYREAVAFGEKEDGPWRVVLIRDVGNDVEGLTDRAWAYLTDGKLPETFSYGADQDSGIRVPQRYHRELARG